MNIKDFFVGFCIACTLMIAADYVAVKRHPNSKVACQEIIEAADQYHSIYFLAPGMALACLEYH